MMIPIRVFVYGTLKTGEPNHHVMTETAGKHTFEGKGRTVSKFPLVIASPCNYVMLLLDEGTGNQIHGEVYSVDDEKLRFLDEMEGHPDFYKRTEHEVVLEDGSHVNAWFYAISQWRDDIFQLSTEFLEEYSSKGSHGREFVERIDDGFDLHAWIKGAGGGECPKEKSHEDEEIHGNPF